MNNTVVNGLAKGFEWTFVAFYGLMLICVGGPILIVAWLLMLAEDTEGNEEVRRWRERNEGVR
jgi:hypothetical protein